MTFKCFTCGDELDPTAVIWVYDAPMCMTCYQDSAYVPEPDRDDELWICPDCQFVKRHADIDAAQHGGDCEGMWVPLEAWLHREVDDEFERATGRTTDERIADTRPAPTAVVGIAR